MLICRRISPISSFSKNSLSFDSIADTVNTFWRANSEPCLPAAFYATLLYRTEEVEIVMKPVKISPLEVKEWNLLTRPTVGSMHRVHFVAFLGSPAKLNFVDMSGDSGFTDTSTALDDDIPLELSRNTAYTPVLISDLCNKIAHRRGRPWETLYECTVSDFSEIAYAWSQNALYDADAKTPVRALQVSALPFLFFSSVDELDKMHCLSPLDGAHLDPSCSTSPEPLSLLEALFRKEYGSEVDSASASSLSVFKANTLNHLSDTALHMGSRLQVPTINTVRYTDGIEDRVGRMRKQLSKGQACSVSPSRSLSLPKEAQSAFFKYVKEQNAGCQLSVSSVNRIESISGLPPSYGTLSVSKPDVNGEGIAKDYGSENPKAFSRTSISTAETSVQTVESDRAEETVLTGLSKQMTEKDVAVNIVKSDCLENDVMNVPRVVFSRQTKSRMDDSNAQNAFSERRTSSTLPSSMHSFIRKDPDSSSLLDRLSDSKRIQARRFFHATVNQQSNPGKPPMILVFTADNADLFARFKKALCNIIPADTYTVYHLSQEGLCKYPWIGKDAACLVIMDTAGLDDDCWAKLQQYFNNSGKLLFICQNDLLASLSSCESTKKSVKLLKMAFGERQSKKLGKEFETFMKKTVKAIHKDKKVNQTFHAKDPVGGYKYSVVISKNEDSPLLLYMENAAQQASALFSDATNEQLLSAGTSLIAHALARLNIHTAEPAEIPSLTQGYLICKNDCLPWDMEGMYFNQKFGSSPKFLIRQVKKHGKLPSATKDLLPVEFRIRNEHLIDFDDEAYFRKLCTDRLGKALFFVPVCESTQDLAMSLAYAMPEEPVAVVAKYQTKGKGRSGNQWLNPIGCAAVSFNCMIPRESRLANNISFIQHIFCVAMVEGVTTLHKDLEGFPLRIKWPNDIYYGRTHKMGGLLVNISSRASCTVCTLGGGLNLLNSKPTVCIKDLLPPDLDLNLTIEEYVANVLNKFDYYLKLYENEGIEAFLEHYYRLWLHSREEVTLSDTNEKAVVCGLDQYGFLEVHCRQTGQFITVHPDGNTFDMMKGLISARYH